PVCRQENEKAEICETSWIKHECNDQPCPGDRWYRNCNHCCKMKSTWFCVHDVYYHNCEATGQGSATTKKYFTDRPYQTQDPYDNTDEYSSDSNKASVRIGVVGSIASGAIFTIICIYHFLRNIPFTSVNSQIGGNNGVSRIYPEYNEKAADGGTTIPAYPPPVYTNASLICTQNVTNDNLQNDSPPPYSDINNHHLNLQYLSPGLQLLDEMAESSPA
ncbi:unnamed protein product, partial [Mytilus coruscus]